MAWHSTTSTCGLSSRNANKSTHSGIKREKNLQTIVAIFFFLGFSVPCTFVRIVPHIAFLFFASYTYTYSISSSCCWLLLLLLLFLYFRSTESCVGWFWSDYYLLSIFTWMFVWHCSFPFRMHKFSPLKSGKRTAEGKRTSQKQKLLALCVQMLSIANGANLKWNISCRRGRCCCSHCRQACMCFLAKARSGRAWLGLTLTWTIFFLRFSSSFISRSSHIPLVVLLILQSCVWLAMVWERVKKVQCGNTIKKSSVNDEKEDDIDANHWNDYSSRMKKNDVVSIYSERKSLKRMWKRKKPVEIDEKKWHTQKRHCKKQSKSKSSHRKKQKRQRKKECTDKYYTEKERKMEMTNGKRWYARRGSNFHSYIRIVESVGGCGHFHIGKNEMRLLFCNSSTVQMFYFRLVVVFVFACCAFAFVFIPLENAFALIPAYTLCWVYIVQLADVLCVYVYVCVLVSVVCFRSRLTTVCRYIFINILLFCSCNFGICSNYRVWCV